MIYNTLYAMIIQFIKFCLFPCMYTDFFFYDVQSNVQNGGIVLLIK